MSTGRYELIDAQTKDQVEKEILDSNYIEAMEYLSRALVGLRVYMVNNPEKETKTRKDKENVPTPRQIYEFARQFYGETENLVAKLSTKDRARYQEEIVNSVQSAAILLNDTVHALKYPKPENIREAEKSAKALLGTACRLKKEIATPEWIRWAGALVMLVGGAISALGALFIPVFGMGIASIALGGVLMVVGTEMLAGKTKGEVIAEKIEDIAFKLDQQITTPKHKKSASLFSNASPKEEKIEETKKPTQKH